LRFILRWTVVILPFWLVLYFPLLRGNEVRMSERGMVIRHPYLHYAGIGLLISGPTSGLVFSMFLKRIHRSAWTMFIGGLVIAMVSLYAGHSVALAA